MLELHLMTSALLSCHCGAVQFELARPPETVTECNCSFCRRVGVLWAYYTADEVRQLGEPGASTRVAATKTTGSRDSGESARPFSADRPLQTVTYAWGGRHVDFHRCATCGCLTHWVPRAAGRNQRGFNARLLDPKILAAARLRHKDGAVTGKYLD